MLERLSDASNAHDADRLASLVAEDYQSSQPLHPGRDFVGRAQVLQNWLSVFEGVPDFSSELVASAVNGETEWGESYWRGHHTDGSAFAMRGVTIFVVRDGLVVEGRCRSSPSKWAVATSTLLSRSCTSPRVRFLRLEVADTLELLDRVAATSRPATIWADTARALVGRAALD